MMTMGNRNFNRLSAKAFAKLLRNGVPGRYNDGQGLHLVIVSASSAHWERRYQPPGALPHVTKNGKTAYKSRYLGLGSARTFGLAEARERNRKISQMLADGIDPISQKRTEKAQRAAAAAKERSFGQCALDYYRAHVGEWRSKRHADQWRASMLAETPSGRPVKDDVLKTLRPMPVALIDTPTILAALRPRWHEKTVSLARLRERVEAVIDAAVAAGFRPAGPNPASWSILQHLLSKAGKTKHFAAMDWAAVPAFVADLRRREGNAARALEFVTLTACRTGEARGARWSEIDMAAKLWVIPGERMKGGTEHRIPLSAPALDLLRGLPHEGDDDADGLVFISSRPGKPLADFTLLRLLRSMGYQKITVHGLRSSFSDWAHEQPTATPMVVEQSLSHRAGGKVALSYRRGDLLAKRRRLLDAWARHCTSPARANAEVVPLVRPVAQS
jgi:integrase